MTSSDLQFLDANIFLRFLTGDNPDQSQRAYGLLQRIENGEIAATTSEAVVLEVVFVLSSKRTRREP